MMILQMRLVTGRKFHPMLRAFVLAGALLLVCGSSGVAGTLVSCTNGRCDACHAKRESPAVLSGTDQAAEESVDVVSSGTLMVAAGANNYMLRGSDASSTCLICHMAPKNILQPQGHYNTTSPAVLRSSPTPTQLTPGGDYSWLQRDYAWRDENGRSSRSAGERHGHNIVAADFDYKSDTTLKIAPGGDYPANNLSCISCHDPHGSFRRSADGTISQSGLPLAGSGSYNNSPEPGPSGSVLSYRMLAGKGYQPKSLPYSPLFSANPPAAVAPPVFNRSESSSDTRVAYGSGMSEWCQNCHPLIHSDGTGGLGHPSGKGAKLSARVMLLYNCYLKSGDFTGTSNDSYTSMVPYEMGTADYALLKATANNDGSNLGGPEAGKDVPNVMCLTCHRSHASGWDSITRWNTKTTQIVYNDLYPGIDNGAPADFAQGRTEAEVRKTFYERPGSRYANHQRSLCNKCHGMD